MENEIDIPTLLKMTISASSEDELKHATDQLMQIIKKPESIQIFLELFENEEDVQFQNHYLIYVQKIINKHWNDYSDEIKNSLLERFDGYIKVSQNSMINYSLANIYSIIYSITQQQSLIELILGSDNNEFIFYWFSRSVNDIPNEVFASNLPKFAELAQWGFSQPDFSHFSESANIYMNIVQLTHEQEIFEPVCQYVIDILPEEPNLGDDFELKNTYWALVDELFHERLLPIDLFGQFLAAIPKSTIPISAINWFCDIVSYLSKEVLIELLQLDIELITNHIAQDETFPEDSFELFENAITETGQRQLIFELINALMEGDEPHKCTGIYLLIPFIQSTPVTSSEEVNFISECLQYGLNSESQVFQEASLRVIDSFEDSSPELVSVFPTLIELTSHYISSPNSSICSLAYASIIGLLDECDDEIEGLLPAVWNLLSENKVQEEMLTSFVEVVSSLIKHTESLDDDIVDSILEWLENIFSEESQQDISVRSACLSIIAAIMTNEESLCDSLLPLCQQTVEEAFQNVDIQGAVKNACLYLDTIACSFKTRSIPIIKPFVPHLSEAIQNEKFKLTAANTASLYTGYSGDNTLIKDLVPLVIDLLKSEDEYQQSCGCSCSVSLSRSLTNDPISLDMFRLIIDILYKEKDQELFRNSLRACKSLFKRCRSVNEEQFTSITYEFLSKLMSGDVKLLDGEQPFASSKIENSIQEIMGFFGVFFQSKPDNATPICESLIEWMKGTNENNIFSIMGALTDALEFCQIDDSVPSEMCSFVLSSADSIKDPDLQQNVSYFLALLCRNFPQQIELVQQVMPSVINWWEKALSKKIGFQEVLANIASLFLSYAILDQTFSEKLIVGALQQFPITVDLLESETMCSSMITIIEKNNPSETILTETALAFSRLFIESQSQLESRKISQEVFDHSLAVFKQLMQNEQIQEVVFSRYQTRKAKKQQLIQLISE